MIRDTAILLVGGAGKIGTAISRGLVASGKVRPENLVVTARHEHKLAAWENPGVRLSTDNPGSFASLGRPVVLLCVHPDEVPDALADLKRSPAFAECPLVISVATGISTTRIETMLPGPIPVVRTMPNLPARIGSAATVLTRGRNAGETHLAIAREIFETIGTVVVLDEKHLNAATGLSGCGPAYVIQIIEALAHGGVQVGLPREAALQLAAQTVKGAAELVLKTGVHPAVLKDEVTTPGGCTIAALSQLERLGMKSALIDAVETATRRAAQLGKPETEH